MQIFRVFFPFYKEDFILLPILSLMVLLYRSLSPYLLGKLVKLKLICESEGYVIYKFHCKVFAFTLVLKNQKLFIRSSLLLPPTLYYKNHYNSSPNIASGSFLSDFNESIILSKDLKQFK
jgi:hypothetical protein